MRTPRTPGSRRATATRRTAAIPALALVAAMLVGPAPTLAAGPTVTDPTTWYVGPQGPVTAQAVGGSCATPDAATIQGAVDASGPGDTIVICDCTYDDGAVTISGHGHDGLTLTAQHPWAATLLALDAGTPAGIVGVVDADGVTITQLRLKTRATCTDGPFAGIVVAQSRGVDVRANRIIGQGPEGDCDVQVGIMANAATGRIRYNLVRDWGFVAIDVAFAGTDTGRMAVIENSMQFAPPSMPPLPSARFGLAVDNTAATARVHLEGNVVSVAKAIRGGPTSSAVLFGIGVDSNHITIAGNRVTGANIALTVSGTTAVLVEGNVLRGIIRDCAGQLGQVWRDNTGRPNKSDPVGLCTLR